MSDHIESKNLVPFSKRRNTFQLPGVRKDRDEEMLEQVDPDLTPEDEGVILRYLQYADTLLGGPDREGLTLVAGGGPAKKLAAIPDNLRHAAAGSPVIKGEDQNGQREPSETKSKSSETDEAA
jgi:hypothetical protein